MNKIVRILMERDGMTLEEAQEELRQARIVLEEEGCDPEELLYENFSLEPDYIFDLIGDF